ncbi:hypothetical protein NUW58_g2593 [Xylaria curta]|uniref:Uncharacterized protein n=1 Tax=Xylaria curta TaxID=42375 RepID=A0ACC1PG57_9PEZI|nr:hypothetical protein NUW58_g2593 [Xylaria curta]
MIGGGWCAFAAVIADLPDDAWADSHPEYTPLNVPTADYEANTVPQGSEPEPSQAQIRSHHRTFSEESVDPITDHPTITYTHPPKGKKVVRAANFGLATLADSDELAGGDALPGLSSHFARLNVGGDTTTGMTGSPSNEKPASGSKGGASKGMEKTLVNKSTQDLGSPGWIPAIEAVNQEEWTIWDPEKKKNREVFQDSDGYWYFEKKDGSKVNRIAIVTKEIFLNLPESIYDVQFQCLDGWFNTSFHTVPSWTSMSVKYGLIPDLNETCHQSPIFTLLSPVSLSSLPKPSLSPSTNRQRLGQLHLTIGRSVGEGHRVPHNGPSSEGEERMHNLVASIVAAMKHVSVVKYMETHTFIELGAPREYILDNQFSFEFHVRCSQATASYTATKRFKQKPEVTKLLSLIADDR